MPHRNLKFKGVQTSFHEGLILGNGDLGAVVTVHSDKVVFHLGKGDCWDARLETDPQRDMLRQEDLIDLVENYGWEMDRKGTKSLKPVPEHLIRPLKRPSVYHLKDEYFRPCPKRVGEISVEHPGLSSTEICGEVSVMDGILTVNYRYSAHRALTIEAFVHSETNLICVRLIPTGELPWCVLGVRKYPDAVDDSIPLPEVSGYSDVQASISQEIPGEGELDPFQWSVAAKFPWKCTEYTYEVLSRSRLSDAKIEELCIAVATSREVDDSQAKAREILAAYCECGWDQTKETHRSWWKDFWKRSSIALEDKELEASWYRDLYCLACNLRQGKCAPGLFGNMTKWDGVIWHSDYHMNVNFQRTYYPVLSTNHVEMLEPAFDFLLEYKATAEWLTEEVFGVKGMCIDGVLFPYQPFKNTLVSNFYRCLANTGWTVQLCWWYYEYIRDTEFLRTTGYPLIKGTAEFYYNYLEKYQNEEGEIYPSAYREVGGWTRGFATNKNTALDLMYFRKMFEYAIKGARLLETDRDWQEKWQRGLERIPEYEIRKSDGKEWIACWKTHGDPEIHDIRKWPASWLVFPGEEIDPSVEKRFSGMARDVLEETAKYPVPIHHATWYTVASARLQMPNAYQFVRRVALDCRHQNGTAWHYQVEKMKVLSDSWGLQVEDFATAQAVTELLLQSFGGVIRVFPAWPSLLDAAFSRLRTEGAFLVSSQLCRGRIEWIELESLVGGGCKVWWRGELPEVKCRQHPMGISVERLTPDIVRFDTEQDRLYRLEPISGTGELDQLRGCTISDEDEDTLNFDDVTQIKYPYEEG